MTHHRSTLSQSTDVGIAAAGIDVRLCDIGAAVQECMESHDPEPDPVANTVTYTEPDPISDSEPDPGANTS